MRNEIEFYALDDVTSSRKSIWMHTVLGVLFGMLVLHPITMVVYAIGTNPEHDSIPRMISSVFRQTFLSFEPSMWLMASIYIVLGLLIGAGAGWYYVAVRKRERLLAIRNRELAMSIDSLVLGGENHRVEFKTSIRWDMVSETVNKILEHSVVKTIAGFMNGGGGVLLIGVTDDGTSVGLEKDYATLKKPGRDGYHQHIMHLISSRLGPGLCDLVTVRFQKLGDEDVCIVSVTRSQRPVFVSTGAEVKYFLRTGNSTRELNTRDAIDHVKSRFPELGQNVM